MSKRCLIIAEAGVNHNGDLALAKRLVEAAAESGADLVKFQTFNADLLATESAPMAQYQVRNTQEASGQHGMLKKLELTPEMHKALLVHCKRYKIGFFSTAFDLESLNFLHQLGLDRFKVPSGEITNLPYLKRMASFCKSIILSTGMANLGEVESALNVLLEAGAQRDAIVVLHCNTDYPTPIQDVNLRAMQAIAHAFGVDVGYSDHTLGTEVAIAAVAMGAVVIEKHLTLDRNLAGPDHKASLEPPEFAQMVAAIRNTEAAMGDGIKRASPSEAKNIAVARKSIVASRNIKAGELFSEKNLTVKRPGSGVSPMRWNEVVGRVASRDFAANDLIEL